MGSTTSNRSTSSASPLSTGGTDATQDSNAFPDSEQFSSAPQHLDYKQEPSINALSREPSDECEIATRRLHQFTGLSSSSLQSSPSSASHVSSSIPARTPLRSLVDNSSDFDTDSCKVTMQYEQPLFQQRSRMLSAPLPSVPPSTPSSVGYRACRIQSYNHNALSSPSSALLGSPTFIRSRTATSPLVRQRSESQQSLESELSDTPSVEIISADIEDSFVTGRFEVRDGSTITRVLPSLGVFSKQTPLHSSLTAIESTDQGTQDVSLRPAVPRSVSATTAVSIPHIPMPNSLLQELSLATSLNRPGVQLKQYSPNTSHSSDTHRSTSESATSERNTQGLDFLTAFDRSSSHPLLPTSTSIVRSNVQQALPSEDSNGALRTPNVYINGLPPHFPDESLYAMTRDFGHVLSVRTFTRCVGEKMSGYGFVLFDSVDAAERCIETLRKYRNLHPSFSKQIHKIPGTPYATGAITIPPTGSLTAMSSQHSPSSLASFPSLPSLSSTSTSSSTSYSYLDNLSLNQSSKVHENRLGHRATNSTSGLSASSVSDFSGRDPSFRERMERLKDDCSTNLYMEGLPLSIDDVSLAALVSPYKVVSRRFFQTKLSNPPRMIAFVRLETRQAAEEVIERLHGRVVRGWNDNGCRISVRFADTNAQRELRRSERLARGEDEDIAGTGRLSMAHAALLNLRGAEAQAQLTQPNKQHSQIHAGLEALSAQIHMPFQMNNTGMRNAYTVTDSPLVTTHGQSDFGTSQRWVSPTEHLMGQNAVPSHTTIDSSKPLDISTFHSSSIPIGKVLTLQAGLSSIGQTAFAGSDIQSSLSARAMEASRLALLQQEAQLKQLQLLQQMQDLREHGPQSSTAIIESQTQAQHYSLMPSAKIKSTEAGDRLGGEARLPSVQHYSQASLSKKHLRDKSIFSPRGDDLQLEGRATDVISSAQPLRNNQQSSSQTCESFFGSPHHSVSGVGSSLDHRSPGKFTHVSDRTEEISTISPALTFASRTPSTMSPATPFFSSFGTPASAPASFPKRKAFLQGQDYRQNPHNEFQP